MSGPRFLETLAADLESLSADHRRRACPELAGSDRIHPIRHGSPLLAFASNDYLGLASHPAIASAAARSAALHGFGAGAARLVTGSLPPHQQLESDLASFLGLPDCLLFPTGYQANIGVITALACPTDLIVSDQANHASLIDGCRLSRATVRIYPHGDARAARAALSDGTFRRRLLVTESLFSMDGDVAPVAELAAAATAAGAALVVDEAHALGVLGPDGRGICASAGIQPDVLVGTLGKAFGSAGGFAAGGTPLRAYLLNHARTFIFTTAPPPPVAAAASAAIHLAAGPDGHRRRAALATNRDHLAQRLESLHLLPSPRPAAAIIPVILGANDRALAAAAALLRSGIFVPAIRPPTVPDGTARLRVTLSADHTVAEIDRLADALTGALA